MPRCRPLLLPALILTLVTLCAPAIPALAQTSWNDLLTP